MGHKPATQPPVIVDSGNYLDEQQSQWSQDMLDNPPSNTLSSFHLKVAVNLWSVSIMVHDHEAYTYKSI